MATLAKPALQFTRQPHPAPASAPSGPRSWKSGLRQAFPITWCRSTGPRARLARRHARPARADHARSGRRGAALRAGDLRRAEGLPARPTAAMALFRPGAERRAASTPRRGGWRCPSCPRRRSSRRCASWSLADRDWFPTVEGGSLYLRPFMFATEAFLGRAPGQAVQVPGDRQPGGQLLQVGRAGGVDLGQRATTPAPRPAAPARPSAAATTPPASCRRPRRSRAATTRWCSSTPPSTAGSRSWAA